MKVHRPTAVVLTIALAVTLGGAILRGNPPTQTQAAASEFTIPGAPTDRQPERYTGSFLDTSLSAMLARLGVTTDVADKVLAFPDPGLGVGSTIFVYRAQVVTLTDAKKTHTIRTWAKTVGEFAVEQNLELADKDKTVPTLDAAIPIQATPVAITVTRVAETNLVVTTTVPFTTQYKDDASMDKGTNVTDQAGKNGTLKTTYLVRREDGIEVSRTVTKKEQTADPVTQIIRRGTRIVLLDQGQASYYRACGTGRFTAAHKTLPKGSKVLVVNTANGKSVVVTIDDRGPFVAGRVIDLSCDAFAAIGSTGAGVITVKLENP